MSEEEWIYDPDEIAAIEAWRPPAEPRGAEPGVAGLRRRSVSGALAAAVMLGLRDVLEPPRDEAAVVVEAPGEPDDPSVPVTVRFDPESPHSTVAIVRRP